MPAELLDEAAHFLHDGHRLRTLDGVDDQPSDPGISRSLPQILPEHSHVGGVQELERSQWIARTHLQKPSGKVQLQHNTTIPRRQPVQKLSHTHAPTVLVTEVAP